jgi:hypothetical protein
VIHILHDMPSELEPPLTAQTDSPFRSN